MRLIDADRLNEFFPDNGESSWTYNVVIKECIDAQPTVYAVPVVRCKDCKHNQLPPTRGNSMCELVYEMSDIYGYCSFGERRDNETD